MDLNKIQPRTRYYNSKNLYFSSFPFSFPFLLSSFLYQLIKNQINTKKQNLYIFICKMKKMCLKERFYHYSVQSNIVEAYGDGYIQTVPLPYWVIEIVLTIPLPSCLLHSCKKYLCFSWFLCTIKILVFPLFTFVTTPFKKVFHLKRSKLLLIIETVFFWLL